MKEYNFVGHEQLWRKKKYSGSGFRTNKKERDVELTLSEIGERGVCVCVESEGRDRRRQKTEERREWGESERGGNISVRVCVSIG